VESVRASLAQRDGRVPGGRKWINQRRSGELFKSAAIFSKVGGGGDLRSDVKHEAEVARSATRAENLTHWNDQKVEKDAGKDCR
jgi:hypothetical protein